MRAKRVLRRHRTGCWFARGLCGLALVCSTACTSVSPQLAPTDYRQLEQLEALEERQRAYAENAIYPVQSARGLRFVKGTSPYADARDWKGLDLILRSDARSAAMLPVRPFLWSRILLAFALSSGAVAVTGLLASERTGFDSGNMNGPAFMLVGGGVGAFAFGLASGMVFQQAKYEYHRAVDVYNDSLGLRLGLLGPDGRYDPTLRSNPAAEGVDPGATPTAGTQHASSHSLSAQQPQISRVQLSPRFVATH